MGDDNVIQEILKGNGDHFDVKKILIAHIKDGYENRKNTDKFRKFVRDNFTKGSGKIAANRTRSIISLSLIGIILAYLLGAKLI